MEEKKSETINLLKFRTLGEYNYGDICNILESEKFWMSNLWNLNDTMEGVYSGNLGEKDTNKIFGSKNDYKICSFSHKDKINNSLLWGYYGNGYKGIAIEIKVDVKDVSIGIVNKKKYRDTEEFCSESFLREVKYEGVQELHKYPDDEKILKIITTKKSDWCHEGEYRYITKIIQDREKKEGLSSIGKIVKIYFGNPFANLKNKEEIRDNSNEYKKYKKISNKLKEFCDAKKIPYEDYPKEIVD